MYSSQDWYPGTVWRYPFLLDQRKNINNSNNYTHGKVGMISNSHIRSPYTQKAATTPPRSYIYFDTPDPYLVWVWIHASKPTFAFLKLFFFLSAWTVTSYEFIEQGDHFIHTVHAMFTSPTTLFTQCFQFSVSTKISCIQMGLYSHMVLPKKLIR